GESPELTFALRRAFDSMTEPYSSYPKQRKNSAKKIHHRKHCAGRDYQRLQQAAASQRDRQPASRQCGEQNCRDRGQTSRPPRGKRADMLQLHGGDDGQRDHDGFKEQDRGGQPAHRLLPPVSSNRASPAVMTEPVISTIAPAAAAPRSSSPVI